MEYVTLTSGERRRVHREYVDVYARFGRDGAVEPVCVMWKDGRSFRVDEVLEVGPHGAPCGGRQTTRFRVRFGRHVTSLYLERREGETGIAADGSQLLRWWVNAYDTTLQRDAR